MRNDVWSDDEIKFITENYGKMTFVEMAASMKRSVTAIRTKLCRIGEKTKFTSKWSHAELLYLERNADRMMAKDIAKHLGRTTNSVLGKAAHHDIKFTSSRAVHSDDDVRLCIALHDEGMKLSLIAEKMEISVHTVKSFLYRPGSRYRNLNNKAQQG